MYRARITSPADDGRIKLLSERNTYEIIAEINKNRWRYISVSTLIHKNNCCVLRKRTEPTAIEA